MKRLAQPLARGLVAAGILALVGCTQSAPATAPAAPAPSPDAPTTSSGSDRPGAVASPRSPGSSAPTAPPGTAPPSPSSPANPRFDAGAALRDIQTLAARIGPRHATSRAYREAAAFVQDRLEALGYEVRREQVDVPAGNSWGTPVAAGTSLNLVARSAGQQPRDRHVVVVAHLDTVPGAPGAEDNASGVSVLLELARLAAAAPPPVPVRFIAFGAEEPRGSGDSMHHFGSQQHVATLTRAQRRAILAVVALDRVGVRASAVPVCSALPESNRLRSQVRAAARAVDVPTTACSGNTTSDHWSYAKAGIPAVRVGSVPYAGYHSPADTPDVIDRRQIDRVGRAVWAWLQSLQ